MNENDAKAFEVERRELIKKSFIVLGQTNINSELIVPEMKSDSIEDGGLKMLK